MKSAKKISLLLLLLLMLLLPAGCWAPQRVETKNNIAIEKGALDLSSWDFHRNGNVSLDGQWEFYWDKLLTYSAIKSKMDTAPALVDVPSPWTAYSIDGQRPPGLGYGTYRLRVKTSLPANSLLSLKINTFSSAYVLYVNDREVASNGKVGVTKEQYQPEYKPQTAIFNIPASEFDMIVQVANYDFCKGGFWYSLYMGSVDGIVHHQDLLMGKELLVIGALVILALYYFNIYLLSRREKKYLYFALICLLFIFALDTVSEMLIGRVLTNIPFRLLVFIWYASTQWVSLLLVLYTAELFPARFNKLFIQIFSALTLAVTLIFVFTPVTFYTEYGEPGNYLMLSGGVYSIILAAIGLKQKKQGAGLYLLAIGVLLFGATHDVLFVDNIISSNFGEISSVCFLILLFVHTLIHARSFRDQYIEKERLFIEVQRIRDEAIQNEIKFLQAQIKPHFLYNSLSVISSLITYQPEEANRLIIRLGEYLRNIFDFGAGDHFESIDKELEHVHAYVEIEKARFRNRIQFSVSYADIPEVRIPRLTIQPLVENAIKHGILKKSQGGRVAVNIQKEAGSIRIEVEDDGVGMPAELAAGLLELAPDVKGVGIKNIHKRLMNFYGKGLSIKSQADKGTIISFAVPFGKESEAPKA